MHTNNIQNDNFETFELFVHLLITSLRIADAIVDDVCLAVHLLDCIDLSCNLLYVNCLRILIQSVLGLEQAAVLILFSNRVLTTEPHGALALHDTLRLLNLIKLLLSHDTD